MRKISNVPAFVRDSAMGGGKFESLFA